MSGSWFSRSLFGFWSSTRQQMDDLINPETKKRIESTHEEHGSDDENQETLQGKGHEEHSGPEEN